MLQIKTNPRRAAVQHRTCGECRAFMLPPVRAKSLTVENKVKRYIKQVMPYYMGK
ncbi:MAG: hypothetical protein K2K57_02100 [Oscillospiraceae bacterium]|nr:hypothetical protein [Oscillospiraceae bacterium]